MKENDEVTQFLGYYKSIKSVNNELVFSIKLWPRNKTLYTTANCYDRYILEDSI